MDKQKIFDCAHLEESSEMARTYFVERGLTMDRLTMADYEKLSDCITDEINILLADIYNKDTNPNGYHMIEKLRMNPKIKKDKEGVYLLTDGFYFTKRQAISFNFRDKIIFCSWASGCNRIPYIKGFVNWCDYLKDKGE